MYDRVLENKLSAFFRLFGTSLALGSLSPRTVYETSRRWEADSKRSTDLCANARNIAAARDFQEAVAGAAVTATFDFDVPVRFAEDELTVSRATHLAGAVPSVPLIEVREA